MKAKTEYREDREKANDERDPEDRRWLLILHLHFEDCSHHGIK